MSLIKIIDKAVNFHPITFEESLQLYKEASLPVLMTTANRIRKKLHPGHDVTWMVDRNVNITNVCISQCKFCSFCRKPSSNEGYVTTMDEYRDKINRLFQMGGCQLLLQGGLHPDLGLSYYTHLFRALKNEYPTLRLHALSPSEIVYIARKEKRSYRTILEKLTASGLDSLPGGGAEILSARVRKTLSPAKATAEEWLKVMHTAHQMNLRTSATMMFGHIETLEERLMHIIQIRQLQKEKPEGAYGFMSFIPWPFQGTNTVMQNKIKNLSPVSPEEYIRTIAISRIILSNISHIQPSSLTVGKETAQICLHAGANDFGSVMIEENVISSSGKPYQMNIQEMKDAIKESGFNPRQRDFKYELTIE